MFIFAIYSSFSAYFFYLRSIKTASHEMSSQDRRISLKAQVGHILHRGKALQQPIFMRKHSTKNKDCDYLRRPITFKFVSFQRSNVFSYLIFSRIDVSWLKHNKVASLNLVDGIRLWVSQKTDNFQIYFFKHKFFSKSIVKFCAKLKSVQ